MRKENSDYNDFAILYRTNAQSRAFEDEMLKQGISYRVYGGLSFYQRKEIKESVPLPSRKLPLVPMPVG